MGALAAMGFVLCARVSGDRAGRSPCARPPPRPRCRWRPASTSASRRALAALAAGVVVLLLLAPGRDQLGAAAIAVRGRRRGGGRGEPAAGRRVARGSAADRRADGLAMLAVLLVLAAGAAAALTRLARGSRGERSDAEPAGLLRRRGLVARLRCSSSGRRWPPRPSTTAARTRVKTPPPSG